MKLKFFAMAALTALCFYSKAQTGLVFNQVVLHQVSMPTSTATLTVATVPAGKAWKMENIFSNGLSCNSMLVINGTHYSMPIGVNAETALSNSTAFWFPAGTVIAIYQSSCTSAKTFAFSFLEFNTP